MLHRSKHYTPNGASRGPAQRAVRDTAVTGLLMIIIVGGAAGGAITLHHIPQQTVAAWTPIYVEWTVSGGLSLDEIATADMVIVSLPAGGSEGSRRGAWAERPIPLVPVRGRLQGEIPGGLVRSPAVEYYLRILDVEGAESVFPPGAPEAGLYRTTVFDLSAGSDQLSPDSSVDSTMEILSPVPGEVVHTARPEIAGLIDPPLEAPWEALFVLDGEDLTPSLETARHLFVVTLPDSLERGGHTVTFAALTPSRTVEATWVFFVHERSDIAAAENGWARSEKASVELGDWLHEGPFDLHGRVEVGWAVVAAETTAVESLDVYLPYEETSKPGFDLYAAGGGGGVSILATAQFDPVYDENVHWLVSAEGRQYRLEVGEVFPEFTSTTLEWASGVGILGELTHGSGLTRAVAMRMSEADTIGGLGIYSRFALGVLEKVEWSERASLMLSYLHAYDREGSVEEEQRLVEPLRNHVLGSVARVEFGHGGAVEIEFGRSRTSGDISNGENSIDGSAVRAELGWMREHSNRALLRYLQSGSDFYSAGSLGYDPGERGLELECAWSIGDGTKLSGSGGIFRTDDPERGMALDRSGMRFYGRADVSGEMGEGSIRGYGVARYDLIPYDAYDYRYSYAAGGATYRISRVSTTLSLSWSQTDSDGRSHTVSAGSDVRLTVIPRRLSVRGSVRWTAGESDDGDIDYERVSYTLITRWTRAGRDVRVEYRYLEKEDTATPDQSYGEHVLKMGVGASF